MGSEHKSTREKARIAATYYEVLQRDPAVQAIFLFGSTARGEARPDSDIDLLVIAPGSFRHEVLRREGVEFEVFFNNESDTVLFWHENHDDFASFWADAQVIFDREGAVGRLRMEARNLNAEAGLGIGPLSAAAASPSVEAGRTRRWDPALALAVGRAVWLALAAVALTAAAILIVMPRVAWPHHLLYDVPIAMPFVLFLRERWCARGVWRGGVRALDLSVVAVALLRPSSIALGYAPFPPYVSGHALFLTYVQLTTRSATLRFLAAVVMLQVVYLKVVVWGDPIYGGIALGLLAGVLRRRLP